MGGELCDLRGNRALGMCGNAVGLNVFAHMLEWDVHSQHEVVSGGSSFSTGQFCFFGPKQMAEDAARRLVRT